MLAWTKYNAEVNADSLKSGHKVKQQANIMNMITNEYEPQQKHRLGTVSQNYWGSLLILFPEFAYAVIIPENIVTQFLKGKPLTAVEPLIVYCHTFFLFLHILTSK